MATEGSTKTPAKKKTAAGKSAKTKSAPKSGAKKTRKTAAASKPKKTTSKKSTAAKKSTSAKKTTTPQNPGSRKKTASAQSRNSRAKTTTSVKKKSVPKTPTKPVTVRELLQKKFDVQPPEKLYRPPVQAGKPEPESAPPFITAVDEASAQRMKKLLFKKFEMPEKRADRSETPSHTEAETRSEAETRLETEDRTQAATDPQTPAAPTDTAEGTPPVEPPAPLVDTGSEPPGIGPPPDFGNGGSDKKPPNKAVFFAILGMAVLVLLMVRSSINNARRYYIKPVAGAVEIWKGKFAPLGQERILILPGAELPEDTRSVYTKRQAHQLAYAYYLQTADDLLDVSEMPDFEEIKRYLKQARRYADNRQMRETVDTRLNSIDSMVLIYKADVLADRDHIETLEQALKYLKQAAKLDPDPIQTEQLRLKTEAVEKRLATLKAEAEAESKASAKRAELAPKKAETPPPAKIEAPVKKSAEAPAEGKK